MTHQKWCIVQLSFFSLTNEHVFALIYLKIRKTNFILKQISLIESNPKGGSFL